MSTRSRFGPRWRGGMLTIALALLSAGCPTDGGPSETYPPPPPPPNQPPPPPPPPPPGPQPGLTAQVAMISADDEYGTSLPAYSPTSVTIKQAGTVTWINNSGLGHSVTFTAVSGAPAGIPVPAVGTNARSFPTVGEFSYHCTVHVSMTGRVIVLP